jgi:uridine kinase
VIFVLNPILKGGNRKTLEFTRKYRKPCLVISKTDSAVNPSGLLRQFIERHVVRVLNIAGSRASMEPRVAGFVQTVLDGVKPQILSTLGRRPTSTHISDPHPQLVAVVGGSGSGKTWLAKNLLRDFAPNAARLSLDDFYHDRSHLSKGRRAKINFDHPRAIDWQRFETVLRELHAGRVASVPAYDFATHARMPQPKVIRPKPLIFVDGLWLLHRPSVRRLFSYSIFLECSSRTRLRRRFERDLRNRGRTVESIRQQFWRTVEPMHGRYVAPQYRWADLVMRRTCRPTDLRSINRRIRSVAQAEAVGRKMAR